jgi:hypothetical protein
MSIDPKSAAAPVAQVRHKGMRIFTYPKIIFIWPTMVTAIICFIGMTIIRNETRDPTKTDRADTQVSKTVSDKSADTTTADERPKRFSSAQNVFGVLFITVFGLNILIMAIDFPRFTIIAGILLAVAVTFFLLWLSVYFNIVHPLVRALESIFAVANSGFYLMISLVIAMNLGVIWAVRYLDYWEILPNEILHNHGPFSDLERFPTTNLKFDKEIPDILEYALLRSGRLVLHVQNERKAIVLDNVLWIDRKEEELKKLMSRMEVRITTDQEAAAESV